MSDYLNQVDPNNLQNMVLQLQQRLEAVERAVLSVEQLSDMTNSLGSVTQGEMRFSDAEDRVRMIISAINLLDEYGVSAHLLGRDANGTPQVWISADDGSLGAAGGAYLLSALGIDETGVDFLERHTAVIGGYNRRFRRGFQELGGIPSYVFEYENTAAGTNLITSNPGFESGNLTGWTGTGWSVGTYDGDYAATCFGFGGDTNIFCNKYGVSPGLTYNFGCTIKATVPPLPDVTIVAEWFNASNVLIQTDTVYSGSTPTTWTTKSAAFIAPAAAATARIKVSVVFWEDLSTFFLDDAFIYDTSASAGYSWLRMNDDGVWLGNKLRLGGIWHTYGGFQNANYTLPIATVNTWTHVTKTGGLWVGTKADGFSLASDVMTVTNKGDYIGSLSMTFSALAGKDFRIRVYNVTQGVQMGYMIGASGTGASNNTNIVLPLYLSCNAGDRLRVEMQNTTDASDPTLDSAVFYIAYLHD